ncbi:MAG: SsrA-binding protein SmpB [Eubacteriales bacterium]|nr:SsrA-binding protein SmpB [Eubacteriales bacterium]
MGIKIISNNKKAYHEYFIIEKYEAGIELFGTEVKSIRKGGISIKEAYCRIYKNEAFIENMHINPYEEGNIFNKDPYRNRKLLLHKNEIKKISEELALKGYTLVPLQVYFKNSKIKIEIGLCKGKKNYDKRLDLEKKDIKRNLERTFKAGQFKI